MLKVLFFDPSEGGAPYTEEVQKGFDLVVELNPAGFFRVTASNPKLKGVNHNQMTPMSFAWMLVQIEV